MFPCHFRPLASKVPLVVALCLGFSPLGANEFADDFSVNSTRYASGSFNDSSRIREITTDAGAVRMAAIGNESGPGSAYLEFDSKTDSLEVDLTLSSESELTESNDFSAATIFVEGYFYNDTFDTAMQSSQDGDVWINLTYGVDQFGNTNAHYCFSRSDANGFRENLSDESGTDFCNQLAVQGVLNLDTRYTASITLDRDAKQAMLSIGEFSRTIDIPGDIYPPSQNRMRLQAWQNGLPGTVVAFFHRITTDEFADDFASVEPVLGRYQPFAAAGSSQRIANEELLLSTTSNADNDDWFNAGLELVNPTGYLEAKVAIADELLIVDQGDRLDMRFESLLYNDTVDGGFDGRTGDVRAELVMEMRGDGRKRVEYCLRRYDDADANTRTGLLDGSTCRNLPVVLETGRVYRMAMGLDRTAPAVVFQIDGHRVEVPVETGIFSAAQGFDRVQLSTRNGVSAVVSVDDLRSSPAALTASEIASGLTAPAAFPEAVEQQDLLVDSTLFQAFSFNSPDPVLDFVDDFSGPSSQFGFWGGRDRGESAVYYKDGAIHLESNVAPGSDRGNYTELRLAGETDAIEALVSLSSQSRYELTGDTGGQVQVRATFYNDTQDYGFNDNEGDMMARLRLTQDGDGRRRVRVNLHRIGPNDDWGDNLLEDVQELESGLEAIVPSLDTPYRLRLSLDRVNRVLRYEVDEQSYGYQIPSEIFVPARRDLLVAVDHWRNSGATVGLVHSITTDTIDENFALSPPVLAPYRPDFNGRYPGRKAEVVDGRLRLYADGTLTSGRDPRITALKTSRFVGADIELSSDTQLQPDGEVFVGVSGTLFGDIPEAEMQSNSEGHWFAATRLTATGTGDRYVQY